MKRHVLIVENHPGTRTGLCDLFKKSGVKVRSTGSIAGALKGLAALPSLVVVDLSLSDGSGVEVLKAIREFKMTASVATISSKSDAPSLGWISTYKPDAVFGKPFDFKDFSDWLSDRENAGGDDGQSA